MLALISELSPRTRLSLSVRKHIAAEEQRCEVSRLPSVVSVHPHSSQVGKALLSSPPLPPTRVKITSCHFDAGSQILPSYKQVPGCICQ